MMVFDYTSRSKIKKIFFSLNIFFIPQDKNLHVDILYLGGTIRDKNYDHLSVWFTGPKVIPTKRDAVDSFLDLFVSINQPIYK